MHSGVISLPIGEMLFSFPETTCTRNEAVPFKKSWEIAEICGDLWE
jgi:hypothetical protein